MQLEITDDQSIAEVQKKFHNFFPFLKVDFFERDIHGLVKNKFSKPLNNSGRLLGEFRIEKMDDGELVIRKESKVKEFEQYIDSAYSLHAQVFRLSGTVWLETTVTNNWSLEEQNRQGENITKHINIGNP